MASSVRVKGLLPMAGDDTDLRAPLETLDPKARDDLRNVLIRDQADRHQLRGDRVASP
jgi:hypothetical protein